MAIMGSVGSRHVRAIKAQMAWSQAFGKDPAVLESLKNELHSAMLVLLIQLSPEIRERSEPLRALMLEARDVGESEHEFTHHDRIQCIFHENWDSPGSVRQFEFRHNQVQIERERAIELLGY